MKNHIKLTLVVALLVVFTVVAFGSAAAGVDDSVINEFLANNPGADSHEFVEIFGDPNTDLSSLTILQIEGDGSSPGIIDSVLPVGTTDADGYWRTPFMGGELENGTLTLMLVSDFTGEEGDDIDSNNDGTIDIPAPWTAVVDDVAKRDGSTEITYSTSTLDPGFDGDNSEVDGASRIPNGTDTDAVADWMRNDDDGAGLPDFDGTPTVGEAYNTPGEKNVAVPPKLVVNEFVRDHSGSPDTEEFVELLGASSSDFSDSTILELDGGGVITGIYPVGSTDSDGYWWTGYLTEELGNATITLKVVQFFTGSVGDDLDTDNDGELDIEPWVSVSDDVAATDDVSGDNAYSKTVLTPDYDGKGAVVGGASRIPNGIDNNIIGDWMRNVYDGIPAVSEALNTPNAENEASPEVCGDAYIPISSIQGSGSTSPIEDHMVVTEGVVVGDFQAAGQFDGFYIQDPVGDGNPATSDGIFVFAPGSDPVAEGDAVRVRGIVSEFSNQTQISWVSLLLKCSENNSVVPTDVTLPVTDLGDWEMYEGMLVNITNELFVSDVFNLVRWGETTLAAEGVNLSPTNVVAPGLIGPEAYHQANLKKSVLLDDGSFDWDPWEGTNIVPYTGPQGTLRLADTITGITAVSTDNRFGYRLQPTTSYAIDFNYNDRPETPAGLGVGTITVATFNLHNYWTTVCPEFECRGADDEDQLEEQRTKLVDAIKNMGADIIGLQELESFHDDTDPANDDYAVADLVGVLNTDAGSEVWAYVSTPVTFTSTNAIINGIIYQKAKVNLVGASTWLDDEAFDNARPPIAQTFDAKGETFTVVVNHFKSKSTFGCPGPEDPDGDQDDGQACFNATRVQEAEALVGYVSDLQNSTGDDDVIVLGDLNAYIMEDPIQVLDANSSGVMNQVAAFIPTEERRSFTFFGESGELDYIYTSDEMEFIPTAITETNRITGVDIWHLNPDEPDGFDFDNNPDLSSPPRYRSSDHDPVIMGFCDTVAPVVTVTVTPDWIWPPNHRYKDIVVTVSAEDNFDGNPTIWHEDEGWYMSNEPDNGTGDGNTTEDIILVAEGESEDNFKVRAERAGHGSGRTYTFTYKATDSCGNVGTGEAIVLVPHDMRNKKDLEEHGSRNHLPLP